MTSELYESIARGADAHADRLDSLAATLNHVGVAAKEKLAGTVTGKDKQLVGLIGLARKEARASAHAFREAATLARREADRARNDQERQRQARVSGGRS